MAVPQLKHLARRAFIGTLLTGFAFVAVHPTSPAKAAETNPEKFIHDLAEQALTVVTDKSSKPEARLAIFSDWVNRYFDMKGIARFLVGRYWRLATKEEREAYFNAFSESTVYTYFAQFGEYSGQTLKVHSSKEDGRFTLVHSEIVDPSGKPPVRVDWRLLKPKDEFKIIDVVIEGVSMAITQRQEYASVIQRSGGKLEGLTNALSKRLAILKQEAGLPPQGPTTQTPD